MAPGDKTKRRSRGSDLQNEAMVSPGVKSGDSDRHSERHLKQRLRKVWKSLEQSLLAKLAKSMSHRFELLRQAEGGPINY